MKRPVSELLMHINEVQPRFRERSQFSVWKLASTIISTSRLQIALKKIPLERSTSELQNCFKTESVWSVHTEHDRTKSARLAKFVTEWLPATQWRTAARASVEVTDWNFVSSETTPDFNWYHRSSWYTGWIIWLFPHLGSKIRLVICENLVVKNSIFQF